MTRRGVATFEPKNGYTLTKEKEITIANKVFVGNMSFDTTQVELESLFSQVGVVTEIFIPTDRATGRPRGFAFVTMANEDEGRAAIETMNGREVDGRTITVNEARPKAERGGRGGGGGRRW